MLNRKPNARRVPAIQEMHAATAAAASAEPQYRLLSAVKTPTVQAQPKINSVTLPFFLDKYEVDRYRLNFIDSIERIRKTIDDDLKKLDTEIKTESNVCNRMFSSIIDKFTSLLEANLAVLSRSYPSIQTNLDDAKELLLSEAKHFDHQIVSQFADMHRFITTSVINFYAIDFELLFEVQANYLTPHLIDGKLNFLFDQLVNNLLAEENNMASTINALVARKMDFALHTAINFKTYLSTSLSVAAMSDHRLFTASELALNDLFNDLVHRIQKLKIVTVLNVNNLFSKNFDKDQRMIHLELLHLRDVLFGVKGAQLLQHSTSNPYTGYLNNFAVPDNFNSLIKQPSLVESQPSNLNSINSGLIFFIIKRK